MKLRLLILVILLWVAGTTTAQDPAYIISYGDSVTEDLIDAKTGDRWYFEGKAGDIVAIILESKDFDTLLELRLLENDTLLAENDDAGIDTSNSAILPFELPTDGYYVLIVRDYAGESDEEYTLTLSQLELSEAGGETLYLDETILVKLGETTESNTWQFEGKTGEVIEIKVESDAFDSFISIVRPNGRPFIANDDADGLNAGLSFLRLREDGIYTLIISVAGEEDSAAYAGALYFFTLRNYPINGELVIGEVVEGELPLDDVAVWIYEGKEGASISVEVTSSAFDPYVKIYDEDAVLITEDDDSSSIYKGAFATALLEDDGYYVVVVSSSFGDEEGAYRLLLDMVPVE